MYYSYHFCELETIKGEKVGDPMICFNNFLLIHQLLYVISGIQTSDSDSKDPYATGEEFVSDLEKLREESEEITGLTYAIIVNRLLRSNIEVILEETRENANVSNFLSECLRNVQLIQETEEYDLIFSSRQENSTEPMEGLVVRVDGSDIKSARYLLKQTENVYLTVIIPVIFEPAPDFSVLEWHLDFVTGLCIQYCDKLISFEALCFEKVIPNLMIGKLGKLKILKLINMLVSGTSLKKVAYDMRLESLNFINCCFYCTEGDVERDSILHAEFSESCKTICLNECDKYSFRKNFKKSYSSCYSQVFIDVSECKNLKKLDVTSPEYTRVVRNENYLCQLQELSLYIGYGKSMLPDDLCFNAQLEYLSINAIEMGEKVVVQFLMTIDKSKLRHLIIRNCLRRCNLEVLDIFKLTFDALETLEIETGYLKMNGFDGKVNMKKLKSLTIRCTNIEDEFVEVLNQLESLTALHMDFSRGDVKIYKDFSERLSLKKPLKYLHINHPVPLKNLEDILRHYKNLEHFKVEGEFCSDLDKQAIENLNKGGYSGFYQGMSPDFFTSQAVTFPSIKTLSLSAYIWASRYFFDSLDQGKILVIFPNVEELVIHSCELEAYCNRIPTECVSEIMLVTARAITDWIDKTFSEFKNLRKLTIVDTNDDLYKEFRDEISKIYSCKGKTLWTRFRNSGRYNCVKLACEFRR